VAPAGDIALAEAAEVVSREIVVPLGYDGLLRRPLGAEAVIDRRTAHSRGTRAVPGYPEDPPDLAELQATRPLTTRQLRASRPEHRDSELLAVKGIDRRDARALLATALIFAPTGRGSCEVTLIVNGEVSADRGIALTNAGHVDRLRLSRDLRATKVLPLSPYGPPNLRSGLDLVSEARLRNALIHALRDADEARLDEPTAVKAVREARQALAAHTPRTVAPSEHRTFVNVAAGTSERRLLISGGRLTVPGVDDVLLRRLRRIAGRGVPVRIEHDGVVDGHGGALSRLNTFAEDYPSVIVEQRNDPAADHLLISDDRWLIAGLFDWLGHEGDAERPLADRRSILTADVTQIDDAWMTVDGRSGLPSQPRKRYRRRRRPPRSRA
jgi:hypothetical protein